MLALWMFGSQFEMDWGERRFLEFYFSAWLERRFRRWWSAMPGFGAQNGRRRRLEFGRLFRDIARIWSRATVGASGGIYGLLIAFGILYGDRQIYMFPLPFSIRAKYMVGIWIFIALVGALQGAGGVANSRISEALSAAGFI